MDINFEKGTIKLYEKNIKLEPLIKRLSLLSGEQVYHFLNNRGIQLPRIFNCYALMSVLNQKIKFLHSKSLSKDYFTRLQYYRYFTEQQLFNLFRKICNDEVSFYMYRYNFFKLLLMNFVGMNLNDGEVTYLKNLKKGSMESFEEYFNYISSVSLEQENSFDGRNINELKEMLPLSASNQDIFDLAGKYGIELPTRLKKQQFLDFIIYYLKKNNEYNDAMATELGQMTVTQLTTYARRTGIPMQPAMSKNDLITYLFYYLEQCEIEYTSIKRIELSEEFEPLQFTIDFSAINNFQNDDPQRVIHYDGEDEDETEFNEILKEDIDDEEVVEAPSDNNEEPSVTPKEVIEENASEDNNVEAEATIAEAAMASSEAIPREEETPSVAALEPEEEENTSIAEPAENVQGEEPEAMASSDEAQEIEADDSVATLEPEEEELDDEGEDELPEVELPHISNEDESPVQVSNEEIEDDTNDGFSVEYIDESYKNEVLDDASNDLDSNEEAQEEEATPIALSDEETEREIDKILAEANLNNSYSDEPRVKSNGSFSDCRLNDHLGDKKIEKYAKGRGKGLTITICIVLLLAVLGFCAWFFLLNK